MAGGSGTRLWPLSRKLYPKQLHSLVSSQSLLQDTFLRLSDVKGLLEPTIICNSEHRFIVAEQMSELEFGAKPQIILEPVGRNTAPAIALAALHEIENKNDSVLLVLAADHHIEKSNEFISAIEKAVSIARQGKLVTFGVAPTSANTGYGYIQSGQSFDGGYKIAKFTEKPNLETAEQYLTEGNFYWNSGMFCFTANSYLEALEQYRPDILAACLESYKKSKVDLDFIRVDEESFTNCPSESVDYAIFEETDNAVMIPMSAGWSDIGAWDALWDISKKNENGNFFDGDVICVNTKNLLVKTSDKLYRPWGKYDSVDEGRRFKVKRITVKPGAKLSVQMHHHRAEHWIVVSGIAKVTNGDKTFLVRENESTFIPVGQVHALENPGKLPLELIEVQSGEYLGEDDIVRFEDRYGRVEK